MAIIGHVDARDLAADLVDQAELNAGVTVHAPIP